MKKWKKYLSASMLTVVSAATLAACSNKDSSTGTKQTLMKNARKSPYFNAGMDRAKLT